tara:strand:+ start:58 stop:519 length:462 start_codon:yes stop_codon:yes gene_type:complete
MKITKTQLKQIIKEELEGVMSEETDMNIFYDFFKVPEGSVLKKLESDADRAFRQNMMFSRANGFYNVDKGNIVAGKSGSGGFIKVSYRDERDPEATDDDYFTPSYEKIMSALEKGGFRRFEEIGVPMSPASGEMSKVKPFMSSTSTSKTSPFR